MKKQKLTIALAGNPNAGKTTLFNRLTGTHQIVGNYPGVTVEKMEGFFAHAEHEIDVIDLPGTYSLTALSEDERVARRFVMDEKPDLIVSVVDASNAERNLYLTVQFMELGVPLIVVLNKSDLAEAKGLSVDHEKLARLFNVTLVKTIANESVGVGELKDAIVKVATATTNRPTTVTYGREVEEEISGLLPLIGKQECCKTWLPRWLALKLLEHDPEIREVLEECGCAPDVVEQADLAAERIHRHFGERSELVIADQRYGFISGACLESVKMTVEVRHNISDRIDDVVTSPLFGIPAFLLMMYALFKITFALAEPPMAWIESFFGWLGTAVTGVWPGGGDSVLLSLLVDGIIGGVGGVLVFVPNIVFLFAAIAFLEDSGYMARGAFIMDRFMHRLGLHGRSFIPALVGFGCTVPAIMATRTLQNRRDRMATMLVLPLISCGARLPIYTLFIAALFPASWRAGILMSLYLIGIALAALLAKLLRSTLFRGEMSLFVMELPPYRMPTPRGILVHTWERTRMFVRKAATVIVVASIILWGLTNYPKPAPDKLQGLSTPEERLSVELAHSVAGRVGHALEPAMRHIGFDWKTTTAMMGAFAAKEIFVAQLGIVYSVGDVEENSLPLAQRLREAYTPLQGFCIMLFCLISMPCVATIAVTRSESGSWKWALSQLFGLTLLAYSVTFIVYQVGMLFS